MWSAVFLLFGMWLQVPVKTIGHAPKPDYPKVQIASVSQDPRAGTLSIIVEAAEATPFCDVKRVAISIVNMHHKEVFRAMLNRSSKCDPIPPGAFGVFSPAGEGACDGAVKSAGVDAQVDVSTPLGSLLASSGAQNRFGLLRAVFEIEPRHWELPGCTVEVSAQALGKNEADGAWVTFRTPVRVNLETWEASELDPSLLDAILDAFPSAETLTAHLKLWPRVETVVVTVHSDLDDGGSEIALQRTFRGPHEGQSSLRLSYGIDCRVFPTPCGAAGAYSGDLIPGHRSVAIGTRGVFLEGVDTCFTASPQGQDVQTRSIQFLREAFVVSVTQARSPGANPDGVTDAQQQGDLRQLAELIDGQLQDILAGIRAGTRPAWLDQIPSPVAPKAE